MKITFKDQVITIDSEVKKEMMLGNQQADFTCNNKEFTIKTNTQGAISKFGFYANTVVDGNLAVVMVLPEEKTLEMFKQENCVALLTCDRMLKAFAEQAEADKNTLDAMFE